MTTGVYPRKFVLERRIVYPHQRSGWDYAVASLEPLMSPDGEGILLDSMIEKNFCSRLEEATASGEVPYRRPWVGFVHVPLELPSRFDSRKSLRHISQLPAWKQSMAFCKGLFVLSEPLGDEIRKMVDVPVVSLRHPTEIPEVKFSLPRYLDNPNPRLIQVGWYLRHLCSIQEIATRRLRRAMIRPLVTPGDTARFERALESERLARGLPPPAEWDVEVLLRQPNEVYDRILSENIVLLHLEGATACNTLVECIARHTPVLVNPLPSVVWYLGATYPLYFHTLEEAAAKAEDITAVRRAHEYLAALPKDFLTGEYFCRSLAESSLYRDL